MRRAVVFLAILALAALAGCRASSTGSGDHSMPPIASVLERHTASLLAVSGVIGTGEGSEGGKPVIVVYVKSRSPELESKLPDSLEGYRVVIRETGEVRALPK